MSGEERKILWRCSNWVLILISRGCLILASHSETVSDHGGLKKESLRIGVDGERETLLTLAEGEGGRCGNTTWMKKTSLSIQWCAATFYAYLLVCLFAGWLVGHTFL